MVWLFVVKGISFKKDSDIKKTDYVKGQSYQEKNNRGENESNPINTEHSVTYTDKNGKEHTVSKYLYG